ncbi:kinase-like protein [Lophium mytilinum]|uniref:Kinase-like protein n=1 Tax=Lophium mytilinum TaxID=390894 RepID=A0A6A6R0N5_9PEZI|nr:kinase-like protein [Lophium mytilinum]
MEYFPDGDLQSHLSSPLPEKEVQQITFQILEGLSFMHDNGFAHRDLKPSNILVKSKGPDWWVKVGDFGISKRAEEGLTALRTFNGTPGFLAPELLVQNGLLDSNELEFGDEYTTAVDIWALGEIVFRALTGQAPFTRSLGAYIRGTSAFPAEMMLSHDISGEGCDFVKSLMAPLPKDRPTAAIAQERPWLESLRPSSPRSSTEFERSEPLPNSSIFAVASEKQAPNEPNSTWLNEASACWSTIDRAAPDSMLSGMAIGIKDPQTARPRPENSDEFTTASHDRTLVVMEHSGEYINTDNNLISKPWPPCTTPTWISSSSISQSASASDPARPGKEHTYGSYSFNNLKPRERPHSACVDTDNSQAVEQSVEDLGNPRRSRRQPTGFAAPQRLAESYEPYRYPPVSPRNPFSAPTNASKEQ